MIDGFVALESRRRMGYRLSQANPTDHLEKGPAYDPTSPREATAEKATAQTSRDGWPAFRKDFPRETVNR